MTVGECHALMTSATKLLFDTFAAGMGAKLKGELDAAEAGMSAPVQLRPDASQIGAYVEELVIQALTSATSDEEPNASLRGESDMVA